MIVTVILLHLGAIDFQLPLVELFTRSWIVLNGNWLNWFAFHLLYFVAIWPCIVSNVAAFIYIGVLYDCRIFDDGDIVRVIYIIVVNVRSVYVAIFYEHPMLIIIISSVTHRHPAVITRRTS